MTEDLIAQLRAAAEDDMLLRWMSELTTEAADALDFLHRDKESWRLLADSSRERAERAEARVKALRAVLDEHHRWHMEKMRASYEVSQLHDDTVAALKEPSDG